MARPELWVSIARVLISRVFNRQSFLSATWDVTARCNSRCSHCGLNESEQYELDTKEGVELIDFLRKKGIRWILFTGGEALLRDDIGILVKAAKDRNISVSVNSNGRLVPEKINEIRTIDKLQLSMEGPEAVHDEIRGKGSYAAMLAALESAKGAGIDVRLTHVLLKNNLKYIDFVLDKAEELKVLVTVQPGRTNRLNSFLANDLAPDPDEYRRVIDHLIERKRAGFPWLCNSESGLRFLRKWPAPTRLPCVAGKLHLNITPNGSMHPCSSPYYLSPPEERAVPHRDFAASFAAVKPVSCEECWCGNLVDVNLAYNGNPEAAASCIRHFLFKKV